MAIRWRAEDKTELARAVKNFNAKIARQVAKGVNPNFLPDKMSVKTLTKNLPSRKALKSKLKSMKKFTRPGAETIITTGAGVVTTKWQIEEIKRAQKNIAISKGVRRANIAKMPASVGGVPTGKVRGQMGNPKTDELAKRQPKNIDKVKPGREWALMIQALENAQDNAKKDELFKANFIKSLENQTLLFFYSPILQKYYRELIEHIQSLTARTVVDYYYIDDANEIYMNYQESVEQSLIRLGELYNIWGLPVPDEMRDAVENAENIQEDDPDNQEYYEAIEELFNNWND